MALRLAAVSVSEKRIARAGREDHHPPLLQMPDRTAADVVLADLVNLQGRHDARVRALTFERVLHRQRVDDRGQHAHLVGRHAVHARLGQTRAAKDVAAADHEPDLDAPGGDFGDLVRNSTDDGRIDAVLLAAQQRFATEFQQNPPICWRLLRHELPTARGDAPQRQHL